MHPPFPSANRCAIAAFVTVAGMFSAFNPASAETKVLLPLAREIYQTNETIDVSVIRAGDGLKEGDLSLVVSGEHGSKMTFTFAVKAPGAGGTTEHLHLNGFLLRPDKYTVEATVDGTAAKAQFEVVSHVRRSSFKTPVWGNGNNKNESMLAEGEDANGFNIFFCQGGIKLDPKGYTEKAGMDFMSLCTMSGAHQMDMRAECDWSDPYVIRGGAARVAREAMADRTRGNVLGVHFYDEPGLTWLPDPATGKGTPHWIPAQRRAYQSAFDKEAPDYKKIDPNKPEDVAAWQQWATWKLGFMDAYEQEGAFGVSYVRPDYMSITQSQYGMTAFTDGYYFNVVRSMPVISGHGGYDDYWLNYFNPSFTLEMARARTFDKPNWYLPCWYADEPADSFRMQQYLSFQTNVQGMETPPDIDPFAPQAHVTSQGVVESNHIFKRLGTVFTTMAVTRPPVAMLYSLSDVIHYQPQDMSKAYTHEMPQGQHIGFTYLAGKLLQQQFLFVVDEDIVDGTLARNHKAVVLSCISYLDPKVVTGLERFAEKGGLVLLTGDCKINIKGAIKLDAVGDYPDAEKVHELQKEGQKNAAELAPMTTTGKLLEGSRPLAKAIAAQLDKAGIKPPLVSDKDGITVTRQAAGDVEYIFAVNSTYDTKEAKRNSMATVVANLTLPGDGRPVYDAVVGGEVKEFKAAEKNLSGEFRFGLGEMRAFARTARPIGAVKMLAPQVSNDLLRLDQPISVTISAIVADNKGGALTGSIPMHVLVVDPLGTIRHDVFRATRNGNLEITLPLAANDAAGEWKVTATELLNNTSETVPFTYTPTDQCSAVAGGQYRAVYVGDDNKNVFRFARVHRSATIAYGSSAFDKPAAERLAKILAPWDVKCKVVDAAEVSKPRQLTEEEAKTWIGINGGAHNPGEANTQNAGFAVEGPVIAIGTPEDNPLIGLAQQLAFLPYAPVAKVFPGIGHGYYAWQRDAVGHGQESIMLIAHDEAGMSEAVGSVYEAVQGMDPLTRWELPGDSAIIPASQGSGYTEAKVAWSANLPDRVVAMTVEGGNLTVVSHDGSISTINGKGEVTATKAGGEGEVGKPPAADPASMDIAKKNALTTRVIKHVLNVDGNIAVAYWGGTLQVMDNTGKVKFQQQLPNDVTALSTLDGRLITGLATGQVLALDIK